MFTEEFSLPDLILEQCIPNCKECPSLWMSKQIAHRIVCRCIKCQHGKIQKISEPDDDEEVAI
jgi:hypothetical protein